MNKRDWFYRIGALCAALLFLVIWVIDPVFSTDETTQLMYRSVVFRGFGSIVFLFVLFYLGFRVFHRPHWTDLAVVLPSLIVAVNNFSILGFLDGSVWTERADLLRLYALDCFLIGAFEELAFRGVFLPALLEKRRKSKKQILWTVIGSSAMFGLIHLVNLLEGAGFGATVLQVGYSFLIGGMCAIVLMKTGNLLYCILLHAVYDFGGRWMTVGGGTLWDTPTVVLTVILAVIVTAWMLVVFLRIDAKDADCLFKKD